jgi:hypothetical protein
VGAKRVRAGRAEPIAQLDGKVQLFLGHQLLPLHRGDGFGRRA